MTSSYRRWFTFFAPIVVSALAAASSAGVAQAAPTVDASCAHPATLTFTPGLHLATQATQIQAAGTISSCVSSQVASGSLSGQTTGNLSCLSGSVSGVLLFEWRTRTGGEARSVVTVADQSAGFLGAGLSGTVTDGLFFGDTYTVAFTANPLALLGCISSQGLTQLSGPAVSTFSHT
jgi:hypothetical protein